jgi:nucleoside-diphosphate-sugar epimerase
MHAALPQDDLDLVLSLTPEFWSCFGGARLFMTGGTGFIGSWLLQALQRANDSLGCRIEVVVLSREPERARRQAPHIFTRPDTLLVAGDISTFAAPTGRLDLCIHAATDVGDPLKTGGPLQVFDSIVLGTRRVLDLAHASGASRFLLTSSGAVYGAQSPSMERIAENYCGAPDPLQPSAAYGNSKRAAEWLTSVYSAQASQSGFASCIARIFALVGPGLPLNGPFAAGNFVRDVLAGQAINVQGDGRPLRSYLYMADLCVWLLRILGSGEPRQAYNVGSENAVSVAELAKQVVYASGANSAIKVQTAAAFDEPAPRYVPDTQKARHRLGLAEYTSLSTALLKTIQWNRSSTAL